VTVRPVTVREGRGHASALSNQSKNLPGNEWEKIQEVKDTSQFLLPAGTHWVERDVMGVAEEVHHVTKGKCRVASCSCGHCLERGHFPHVVLELARNGRTSPVFGFTSFGPHVIHRLREIHVSQGHEKKMREKNDKIRESHKKKSEEYQQEKLEVIRAALESHKHDWRGPNGLRTTG